MLIDSARQCEAHAKKMLAAVRDGSASSEEIREALAVSKAIAGINAAFQTAAAGAVAGRERHGDGGAEVLAEAAGLSRGQARSQVEVAEALRDLPAIRDAVESGLVSQANAKQLAAAVEKAGAQAVEFDGALLDKAQRMRPEQFTKEARRWTVERDSDDGASEHARQRARRCVRMWNTDDGMVRLHGEFDSVTGQRIRNRLRAEAGRMLDADRKNAGKHAAGNNGVSGNGAGRRSFDQCMADALDNLTSSTGTGRGEPFADICVVAHVDEATGELIAQLPDGDRLPSSVLEELACDARFTGVIYDRKGRAIWRAHPVRRATKAQRQLLIARDGGCFACGVDPGVCDVHHVEPVSRGGPTSLDNLVLACWRHHAAVHHFGWRIQGPPGNRTLHPPETATYGPAHAPGEPRMFGAETTCAAEPAGLVGADDEPVLEPSRQTSLLDDSEPAHNHSPPTRAGPATARAALRAAR